MQKFYSYETDKTKFKQYIFFNNSGNAKKTNLINEKNAEHDSISKF